LRVAVNALAIDPRRPGGDGTYVRELVRHLTRLQSDAQYVLFVSHWNRSLFPPPSVRLEHVVCPVPSRSLVIRALWEQLVLPRFVRRAKAHALHAPVNVAPLGVSTPTLLTLLEAEPFMPNSEMPLPLRAYWRVLRSASARKARRVLAISHSSVRELRDYMRIPASKLMAVHLGIDVERFRPTSEPHERYILWVGRSYPRKNLVRLLEAMTLLPKAVRERHPLKLVGIPGWADTSLRRHVIELGLLDCVDFIGRVADADLPGCYQRARLFVFPSLHEAFGLPVLEALACGTPVLAGDIPALRETAGDAAAFADPSSSAALAGEIERLLSDEGALTRARSAGPAQARRFSWDRAAEATHAAYVSAVAA